MVPAPAESGFMKSNLPVMGEGNTKAKPSFPQIWEGTISAPIEENEAAVFLSTLRGSLNGRYVPTRPHVQLLFYLVLQAPPHPSTRSAPIKSNIASQKTNLSSTALDILHTLLSFHSPSSLAPLIPHIAKPTAPILVPKTHTNGQDDTRSRLRGNGRGGGCRSRSPNKLTPRGSTRDPQSGEYTPTGSAHSGPSRSASPTKRGTRGRGRGRVRKGGMLTDADFAVFDSPTRRGNGETSDSDDLSDAEAEGGGEGGVGYGDEYGFGHDGRLVQYDPVQPRWSRWHARSRLEQRVARCMKRAWEEGKGGGGGAEGVWGLLWDESDRTYAAGRGNGQGDREAQGEESVVRKEALSEGGWALLGWLVDFWEKDQREADMVRGTAANLGRGQYPPLFLAQLPQLRSATTALQLSDAAGILRIVRAAFGPSSAGPTSGRTSIAPDALMMELDRRKKVAGRLLAWLINCALPFTGAPFHPPTLILDIVSLSRTLSPSSFFDELCPLYLLPDIPWYALAHLCVHIIEDAAGERAERVRERIRGQRRDWALPPMTVTTTTTATTTTAIATTATTSVPATTRQSRSSMPPPRIGYLQELLLMKPTPPKTIDERRSRLSSGSLTPLSSQESDMAEEDEGATGEGESIEAYQISLKRSNSAKFLLAYTLFEGKKAYIDGYQHLPITHPAQIAASAPVIGHQTKPLEGNANGNVIASDDGMSRLWDFARDAEWRRMLVASMADGSGDRLETVDTEGVGELEMDKGKSQPKSTAFPDALVGLLDMLVA